MNVPEMRALLPWLAGRCQPGEALEAAVVVNVPPGRPNALQGGKPSSPASATACFAWPKIEGSDIDDDMAAYLAEEARDASEVVVGSNETGPSTRQQSDSRQPLKSRSAARIRAHWS